MIKIFDLTRVLKGEKIDDSCPKCTDGKLYQREDDKEETVKKRLLALCCVQLFFHPRIARHPGSWSYGMETSR